MAALKPEKDEGESEGPLQKPSLLSLQNTALKVRDGLSPSDLKEMVIDGNQMLTRCGTKLSVLLALSF